MNNYRQSSNQPRQISLTCCAPYPGRLAHTMRIQRSTGCIRRTEPVQRKCLPISADQPPTVQLLPAADVLEEVQTGNDEKPQTNAQKTINALCLLAFVANPKQSKPATKKKPRYKER